MILCAGCKTGTLIEHECIKVFSKMLGKLGTDCECVLCKIDPKVLKRFIETLGNDNGN